MPVIIYLTYVIIILILFTYYPRTFASDDDTVLIPYTDKPPTIDGIWTNPEEWINASETLKKGIESNQELFIRTIHDNGFLYFLLDYKSDETELNLDFGTVCLAATNDNNSIEDYYCYRLVALGHDGLFKGNSSPPVFNQVEKPMEFVASVGFSGENNPYSQNSHRIYEFKIPIEYIGSASRYAFYVQTSDPSSGKMLVWPDKAVDADRYVPDIHDPRVWGVLESTHGTIPEFPISAGYAFLISAALAIILARVPFIFRKIIKSL
jgi:hypothetical protein